MRIEGRTGSGEAGLVGAAGRRNLQVAPTKDINQVFEPLMS